LLQRLFIVAVVDDDPSLLESLESLLESAGFSVRPFTSATALLDSGALPIIDCLISDIGLPGMDGLELARVAHASRPRLPVILITGQGEAQNGRPGESQHYRLFKKPFNAQELLVAVNEALKAP
jgi:FixJ family two-component response regulator